MRWRIGRGGCFAGTGEGRRSCWSLLTVAVAVSSYGAAFGHALAPSDQATFGSANARIRFSTSDPQVAAGVVSAARGRLGTVEQITDTLVPIPGSVQRLDLRYQDPTACSAQATVRLRTGRYPANGEEIALTPAMSKFLAAPVGGSVTAGGVTRRVVGLVENPTQLDDAFGLVTTAPRPARRSLHAAGQGLLGPARRVPHVANACRVASPSTPRSTTPAIWGCCSWQHWP